MRLDGFPYSWTHYGPDIEGMKIVRHPWFLRNIPGMKVLCVGVGSRQWREWYIKTCEYVLNTRQKKFRQATLVILSSPSIYYYIYIYTRVCVCVCHCTLSSKFSSVPPQIANCSRAHHFVQGYRNSVRRAVLESGLNRGVVSMDVLWCVPSILFLLGILEAGIH